MQAFSSYFRSKSKHPAGSVENEEFRGWGTPRMHRRYFAMLIRESLCRDALVDEILDLELLRRPEIGVLGAVADVVSLRVRGVPDLEGQRHLERDILERGDRALGLSCQCSG